MTPREDPEYVGSVTLMVLGDDLDPDKVSAQLGIEPSQSWRRGERWVRLSDGTMQCRESAHEYGGWKLWVAAEQKDSPVEEQLEFWVGLLRSRIAGLRQLTLLGLECVLDVFVSASETASIVIPNRLQRDIVQLGVEMRISFWASSVSEPDGE